MLSGGRGSISVWPVEEQLAKRSRKKRQFDHLQHLHEIVDGEVGHETVTRNKAIDKTKGTCIIFTLAQRQLWSRSPFAVCLPEERVLCR